MKYGQFCSSTENSVFLEPWQGHRHLGITMTTDVNWLSLKECLSLSRYIREMAERCKIKDWKGASIIVGRAHKSGFHFL